jgi:hypothetical protein
MIAKRPVKIALPFEEMFYTITRHPMTFRIKSAVDANGRLTARGCEVFWNGGAYADVGPRGRLRHEGDGILLIFDNAVDADTLKPYLPEPDGGSARSARPRLTNAIMADRNATAAAEIATLRQKLAASAPINRL